MKCNILTFEEHKLALALYVNKQDRKKAGNWYILQNAIFSVNFKHCYDGQF